MNLFKNIHLLKRLDNLFRTKSTGSPDTLAKKIDLSRRHTERLIADLKDLGLPIQYSKDRQTYYYTDEVKFNFEIIIGERELMRIKGGTNALQHGFDNLVEKILLNDKKWHSDLPTLPLEYPNE